jgi:hypothetical protein
MPRARIQSVPFVLGALSMGVFAVAASATPAVSTVAAAISAASASAARSVEAWVPPTHQRTRLTEASKSSTIASASAAPASVCASSVPSSHVKGLAYGRTGCACDAKTASMGCSADGKAGLRCIGGRWTVLEACTGPAGCALEPDGIACDHEVGDSCVYPANAWCGHDRRSTMWCNQSRKVEAPPGNSGCICMLSNDGVNASCNWSPSTWASAHPSAIPSAAPSSSAACAVSMAGKTPPPVRVQTTAAACPSGYVTADARKSSGPSASASVSDRFCYLRCTTATDCCGWGAGAAVCRGGTCSVR